MVCKTIVSGSTPDSASTAGRSWPARYQTVTKSITKSPSGPMARWGHHVNYEWQKNPLKSMAENR
jgi:hypothetical protein